MRRGGFVCVRMRMQGLGGDREARGGFVCVRMHMQGLRGGGGGGGRLKL